WDVAVREGKLEFWPSANLKDWIAFVAAWATMAIGSIAQQDVFQRVTSAKNEDTAVRGTLLGGTFRSEEHTSELQSRENLVCRLQHHGASLAFPTRRSADLGTSPCARASSSSGRART